MDARQESRVKYIDNATETATHTDKNIEFQARSAEYHAASPGTAYQKLTGFAKYVPRQDLTSFLSRFEIFKKGLKVQGSVVECGVYAGAGLMTWAQLSSILEPMNIQRKVVGFDTFAGFPDVHEKDKLGLSEFLTPGGYAADSYEDLLKCVEIYDSNRFLSHIPKVQLVKGDARVTIPEFVKNNPSLVVSLLYLDFDLYEPTKVAIENFIPRMPKGAIIAFDELNDEYMPGETSAVLETMNLRDLRVERFNYETKMSYAVLD